MGALAGVRILDFGYAIATPYACGLLALAGAEVIRIESKKHLCINRRAASGAVRATGKYVYRSFLPGELPPEDMSLDTPVFNTFNLNKLSVTLDFRAPE